MKNNRWLEAIGRAFTGAGALIISILLFFLLFKLNTVRMLLGSLVKILMPFIYGGVLAYLLAPLCNRIEKVLAEPMKSLLKDEKRAQKTTEAIGILGAMLVFFLVVYLLLQMIIPEIYESIKTIIIQMPAYIETSSAWLEKMAKDNELMISVVDQVSGFLLDYTDNFISQKLMPNIQAIITGAAAGLMSVLGVIKNIFIGLVACIYILGSRKKFVAQGKRMMYSIFSVPRANTIITEIRSIDRIFGGFLLGKVIDSTIIGIICFIIMTIMKMPYIMLVSVVIGVTNIIPFFGPFIGAIPCGFLILMISPMKCLQFIIMVLILQQLDGNIIGPKILGDTTGVSGFWVLFSIIFFSGIWGFVGMIVGVPTFAVIYSLIKRWSTRTLKNRELPHHTRDYKNLSYVTEDEDQKFVYTDKEEKDDSRN